MEVLSLLVGQRRRKPLLISAIFDDLTKMSSSLGRLVI